MLPSADEAGRLPTEHHERHVRTRAANWPMCVNTTKIMNINEITISAGVSNATPMLLQPRRVVP